MASSRSKTLKARKKAAAKKKRRPVGAAAPAKAPKKPAACSSTTIRPRYRKGMTKAQRAAARKSAAKREAARKKACATKKKPTPTKAPAPVAATPNPAVTPDTPLPAPPVVVVPDLPAPPAPTAPPPAAGDHPDIAGPLTLAGAHRLLWRAGFGPRAGEAEALVAKGLDAAVDGLVHPTGPAQLLGPLPTDENGLALAPLDLWGHDHSWWLDRMVRTDQPLVERMTLVWHDWFATSREKVDAVHVLAQNELFRRHALGNFGALLRDVTVDPAMLIWLDGTQNNRWNINENFAREVMELFALGANRGAYTEGDVREAARAMTGWRATWVDNVGHTNFRFDRNFHDTGTKTIFGASGAFGWEDVVRLCLEHPLHPSWVVTKLWQAFVPVPIPAETASHLQALYVGHGRDVAPVVSAILRHRLFYEGPAMVVPPVVHQAGVLRAIGRYVDSENWGWYGSRAGQQLFHPPNVAGWDEGSWLDTSRWKGRWETVAVMLYPGRIDPWSQTSPYSATETPAQALDAALAFCGNPVLSTELRAELLRFATDVVPANLPSWDQGPRRAQRQNALRQLVLTSSDLMAP